MMYNKQTDLHVVVSLTGGSLDAAAAFHQRSEAETYVDTHAAVLDGVGYGIFCAPLYAEGYGDGGPIKPTMKIRARYSEEVNQSAHTYVGYLKGLAYKGGRGAVDRVDARSLGRIADYIEFLEKQVDGE